MFSIVRPVDLDKVRLAADFAKILQKVCLGILGWWSQRKAITLVVHCGHIVIVVGSSSENEDYVDKTTIHCCTAS